MFSDPDLPLDPPSKKLFHPYFKVRSERVKYTFPLISNHILQIINVILSTGVFPAQFKESFLIPIPKKGKSIEIRNYRGIAIQSIIPKILDKFITSRLYTCISPIISKCQHGFMPGRSTISNLLEFTDFLHNNMTNSAQVDVIFFYFSKAFDMLDHYSW